jgi:hypothetical protein
MMPLRMVFKLLKSKIQNEMRGLGQRGIAAWPWRSAQKL